MQQRRDLHQIEKAKQQSNYTELGPDKAETSLCRQKLTSLLGIRKKTRFYDSLRYLKIGIYCLLYNEVVSFPHSSYYSS